MDKKAANAGQNDSNGELKKILAEIEAFDQVQTVDRLRQWLENPIRLPKEGSTYPKNQNLRKSHKK